MKLSVLFHTTLSLVVLGTKAAPFQVDRTTNQPDTTTNIPEIGPQTSKIDVEMDNVILEFSNFLDLIMDPENYTNQPEEVLLLLKNPKIHILKIPIFTKFTFPKS